MQTMQRAKVAAAERMSRAKYRIISRRRFEDLHRRARRGDLMGIALDELFAVWTNLHFTDLPDRDGRSELMLELRGTQPSEAVHLLAWLHQVAGVAGDVMELGCAGGETTALLANEILQTNRSLWVFDSFEGLSAPTVEDELIDDIFSYGSMASYTGAMAYPETAVRARLRNVGFPAERTHVVKGYVEDTLARPEVPTVVAFAYVDMDLYAPIRDALAFLGPRVPSGGIIAVDDYGWFSNGAQRAVDEWLADNGRFEALRPEPWAGHFIGLRARTDPAASLESADERRRRWRRQNPLCEPMEDAPTCR